MVFLRAYSTWPKIYFEVHSGHEVLPLLTLPGILDSRLIFSLCILLALHQMHRKLGIPIPLDRITLQHVRNLVHLLVRQLH